VCVCLYTYIYIYLSPFENRLSRFIRLVRIDGDADGGRTTSGGGMERGGRKKFIPAK